MKYILFLLMTFFVGCSSYVNQWHNQIDNEQNANRRYALGKHQPNKFNMYRPSQNRFDRRKVISKSSNLHSTANRGTVLPTTKRQYKPQGPKRYKANDLVDNSTEGSLWSGSGQDNFLFSRNNYKKQGDIVVINVNEKLKNSITLELSRAFPDRKKKKDDKKGKEGEKTAAAPTEGAGAEDAEKPAAGKSGIYDKISSVVIEEINKDHLLLRGRKDVLYKRQKRLVEVQALIARRDITDNDTVESINFLETSVAVLR